MKKASIGQYLKWEGRLYQVISINDGKKAIGLQSVEPMYCKHCGGRLGYDVMDVIEASPLFQDNAEPIETIEIASTTK